MLPVTGVDSRELAALQKVLPILFGAVQGQLLRLAAQLNIPDHLKSGPKSLVDLAGCTKTPANNLVRVLRPLVALGILGEREVFV